MNFLEEPYLVPIAIFIFATAALWLVRKIIFRILHRWTQKTHNELDDRIITVIKIPSLFWCLAIGLHIGVAFSELPPATIAYITKAIYAVLVISFTITAANLVAVFLKVFIQKSSLPVPETGLIYGLLKGIVYLFGILIILATMGISITPILTALGVGGLAVALALQDTLSNLFAGLHILIEKSIRIGDFVKLENGQEGYVDDITWRTSRIRLLPNNMVIIPNKVLAQSVITNYCLPEKRLALLIPIGVSYASDPEVVEKVLVEEAKAAIGQIPGLLAEPEPFARFIPGFGDSSLDFTLICQVQEFVDQYRVQHELRKRIFKRLKQEGLEIPFPQRTVYLREEKAWNK